MTPVLEVAVLHKRFAGVQAVDGFSLTLSPGEVVGLLGPNGAGKTTVFNLVTGFLTPDSGSASFRNRELVGLAPYRIARLGIARTFQTLRLIRNITVFDNVLLGFRRQRGERLWRAVTSVGVAREQRGHRLRAAALLDRLGLTVAAAALAGELSYGQQKLLSLAVCLAADADVFLLDEPAAGLSVQALDVLVGLIRDLRDRHKAVLLIEHNLAAVLTVADRLVIMSAGRTLADGEPRQVLEDPRVLDAYLGYRPDA